MTERESERQRFDELFALYSSDIVAYCGWRAASASDAQDAVSEVFLTAWRRLERLPEGDAARVWLYATARRVIANQRRSNRRRLALQDRLLLDGPPAAGEAPASTREEELVRIALRRLSLRDREVLLLSEWEGLSPAQIAAVLGCLHRDRSGAAPSRAPPIQGLVRGAVGHTCVPPLRTTIRACEGGLMSTSECIQALRGANPRRAEGFARSVEAAEEAVRAVIAAAPSGTRRSRKRLVLASASGVSLVAAAAVVAVLTIASSGGPGIENATAAVRKAALVTAASAEQSGTAVVRITHEGEIWAGDKIRWNGGDISIVYDAPRDAVRSGGKLLVVDGMLYGVDPADGGWVQLGNPESIDPGSGTTPAEYLAALREDVGGTTLRRLASSAGGLQAEGLSDGSTVYRGTVAAGVIARETGFKEGHAIRMLPFGYVAHDKAADPASLLDVGVVVGADGVVREIAVSWGTWRYTVSYSRLGATPAPTAPADARPFGR